MPPIVRIAACHVTPVYMNARATTQKCLKHIREAAKNGAHIVVFPETYISAYPFWSVSVSPTEAHQFFIRMVAESVYADGEEIKAIRQAAKDLGVTVSIGISEKARYSSATLWYDTFLHLQFPF